jgi:hypothetical protein
MADISLANLDSSADDPRQARQQLHDCVQRVNFLASTTDAARGAGLIGYSRAMAYASGTVGKKLNSWVDVTDYGADPTGVSLSNTAFTNAKAVSNTLYLPPGTYRIEGWTAQDVLLIGDRAHGANDGLNQSVVIEGSGDLFIGANNFAMRNIVMRNSTAGTRGKLVTVANIDTKIGPFIECAFRKATYHFYANDTTKAIVDGQMVRCRFTDASIYSRWFRHGLFGYQEDQCYTQDNARGMYITSCSQVTLSGVMELHDEGALYVENLISAVPAVRSLNLKNLHFEINGTVTPTADITININQSVAQISFDSCFFALGSVAKPVELSNSPFLRLIAGNCTAIDFNNLHSGSNIAWLNTPRTGETNAFLAENAGIRTTKELQAWNGFHAGQGITVTITGSATNTPIATPTTGNTRMVLVHDSTTQGSAILLLRNAAVDVAFSTLTSITWTVSGGFLRGNTTGGASSRVLFFNYMAT